jgi:hypothetical protein
LDTKTGINSGLGIGGVCVNSSIREEKTCELFCGMKTIVLDYFISGNNILNPTNLYMDLSWNE